jgi:uncharacterized protein
MTPPDDESSFLDALRAVHAFPGPYTFKVIGENTDLFTARVLQVVRLALPAAIPSTTTRQSRHGKVQSVTLVVEVPSAEAVVAIYKALRLVPGTNMVL